MCNLNEGCLPTEKKMGDFLFCKNLKQPWAINKPLWIKYISNSLSNSINCMQMNWNPCPVALLFHCPVFPFLYHYPVLPLPCSLFGLLSCFISNALLDQRPFQLQWPNIPYQDISSDLCFFLFFWIVGITCSPNSIRPSKDDLMVLKHFPFAPLTHLARTSGAPKRVTDGSTYRVGARDAFCI